jgi:hypothetical protein
MATTYEWTYEVPDAHGDITEQEFYDSLRECMAAAPLTAEIALVRIVGNDDEGVLYRGYAYMEGGTLPPTFDDGARVPQRFHGEVGMTR